MALNNRNINHQQKFESMVTMKNRFVALLAMVAVVTGLSSCLKNNTTPEAPTTVIAFIQGSPTTYGMDIFFNTKKANTAAFSFGAWAADKFTPGNIKIDFTKSGSDSLLTSITNNFDTLQYNTILLYGSNPVESYRIREDFSTISREKANVRFFNFVEGDAVDFFINTTKVSPSRMFEDFYGSTSFQSVDPATVTISVKDLAGTELATLSDVALNAYNAYSISFMGIRGTTGDRKPVIKILRQ